MTDEDLNGGLISEAGEVEKQIPQSKVNHIIGRVKAETAEQVRREMEGQYAQKMKEMETQSQPQSNQAVDDIDEKVLRTIQKLQEKEQKAEDERVSKENQAMLEKAGSEIMGKLSAAIQNNPDMKDAMSDFDFEAFAPLAFLADEHEGTAEILHELARNPGKAVSLMNLFERSNKMGRAEMAKLAKSIADNQKALRENPSSKAPLSPLKSSTAGADNGKMTVSDLRKQPWLKV